MLATRRSPRFTEPGLIAGVAAAIISHPADTLLSKVNKKGAGGEGSIVTRLGRIATEIGFVKLATVGLGPRCVMIGKLTSAPITTAVSREPPPSSMPADRDKSLRDGPRCMSAFRTC